MGTFYKLAKAKGKDCDDPEFGIDEMSNRLALVFSEAEIWKSTEEMSPEELAKIFLYGLQVCSYWMEPDELKKIILDYVNHNI